MREEIERAVKALYGACPGTEKIIAIEGRGYKLIVAGDSASAEYGIVIKYLTPGGYWWDLEIEDEAYNFFPIIDLWDNRVSPEEITDQIVSCMEEIISKEE